MTPGTAPNHTRASLFRDLLKGTALYSVALFAQRVASIILLPLNTRYLNPSDYGVLELLEQIVMILSVLVGANLSYALGYFYFEQGTPRERNVVVGTTMIGGVLIGIFAMGIGILFIDPIGRLVFGRTDYRSYMLLVFATLPLAFVMEAGFSWLRVVDRPWMFTSASLIRIVLGIGATVLFVAGLKLRVMGVLLSSTLAAGCVAVLLTVYCFREIPIGFNGALFWRMVRFSIPLSLGSIAMFIIHFGDRFVLPHYRPLSDLGIYGIAYKMGMLVSMVSGSFHSYWSAQVFQVARRDDANRVIARIFTYVTLVLSFTSVVIIAFCRPAVRILTTPKFEYAAVLVPLIVGAYFIRSIAEFFRCFFIVEGKPGYEAICNWVGAGVCLTGYFLLIPRFGIWGAGSATALAFLAIGVISAIWSYRLKPYQFEWTRLAKIMVISVGLVSVYLLVPVQPLLLQILWGALLVVAFPALLWLGGFVQPGEVERLRSIAAGLDRRAHLMWTEWRARPVS